MTVETDRYDAMLADIYTLTKRSDLEEESAVALRTATSNAHFCDAFPRDSDVRVVQLANPSFTTQLDLGTLFPRFRGMSQIRALDIGMAPMVFDEANQLKVIELSDIYDSYGALRSNVAYVAGDKINVRTLLASYGFSVSWFKAPATRRTEYNSWIADMYPEVILYWAAAIVLDTSGNEEKAKKYMNMTTQIHIPYLKSNFLFGEIR